MSLGVDDEARDHVHHRLHGVPDVERDVVAGGVRVAHAGHHLADVVEDIVGVGVVDAGAGDRRGRVERGDRPRNGLHVRFGGELVSVLERRYRGKRRDGERLPAGLGGVPLGAAPVVGDRVAEVSVKSLHSADSARGDRQAVRLRIHEHGARTHAADDVHGGLVVHAAGDAVLFEERGELAAPGVDGTAEFFGIFRGLLRRVDEPPHRSFIRAFEPAGLGRRGVGRRVHVHVVDRVSEGLRLVELVDGVQPAGHVGEGFEHLVVRRFRRHQPVREPVERFLQPGRRGHHRTCQAYGLVLRIVKRPRDLELSGDLAGLKPADQPRHDGLGAGGRQPFPDMGRHVFGVIRSEDQEGLVGDIGGELCTETIVRGV